LTTIQKIALYTGLGLLLLGIVLIGGRCYSDARVNTAVLAAQTHTRDSVATAYEAQASKARDSAQKAIWIADSTAEKERVRAYTAEAHARQARRQADSALALAELVSPDSLAPKAQTAFLALESAVKSYQASNDSLVASNTALLAGYAYYAHADSMALRALASDQRALAAKDSSLSGYRALKTPKRSLLAHIGTVALDVGALAAAALLGHAL
jgi:hypothetical protein